MQGLGRVRIAQDALDAAEQALRDAQDAHQQAADASAEADTLSALSLLAARRDDPIAISLAVVAVAAARRAHDARLEGETLSFLALAHHRFGALGPAGAVYAEAEYAAEAAGQTWIAACSRIGAGVVLLERGLLAEARTALERAEGAIAGFDPCTEGLLLAALGAAKAGVGELVDAGWLLDRAERLVQANDVVLLAAVTFPRRGMLHLARADRARSSGDEVAAVEHERRAAERLQAARAARDPDSDRTRGASLAAALWAASTRMLWGALQDRETSTA